MIWSTPTVERFLYNKASRWLITMPGTLSELWACIKNISDLKFRSFICSFYILTDSDKWNYRILQVISPVTHSADAALLSQKLNLNINVYGSSQPYLKREWISTTHYMNDKRYILLMAPVSCVFHGCSETSSWSVMACICTVDKWIIIYFFCQSMLTF